MVYQYTKHNLWSSLDRGSSHLYLHSTQRQMHCSMPRIKKRGLWNMGAAGFGIICVLLLVLHGGSSITKGSSLDFVYPSASTWSKSSTDEYHDVYNETLGVCAAIAKPSATTLLISLSSRESSSFPYRTVPTAKIPLLYKRGYLT